MTSLEEYDTLNIKQLKLTSGDDIIGLINSIDKNGALVVLERPVLINSHLVNKKEVYYMSPYMPMSKNNMAYVSAHHIVAQCEITSDIKEMYIEFCLQEMNKEDKPAQYVDIDSNDSDIDLDEFDKDFPKDRVLH